MDRPPISGVVTASVTMLLCGFYNMIFHLLRRASHLIGTVRSAASGQTELSNIFHLKDIALSVYDIAVLFNLSVGLLAFVQAAAGAAGIIYALLSAWRNKPLRSAFLPAALGALCLLLGVSSVFSLYVSHSAGAFINFTVFVTQLLVPFLFLIVMIKFASRISKNRHSEGDMYQ